MIRSLGYRLLLAALLSCQVSPAFEVMPGSTEAAQLWEDGQAAMRHGQPERAIRCYQQSLAADPTMVCNHLSLAVAYLEKEDAGLACSHLGVYVEAHPEQLLIRARYAELLVRIRRPGQAREEFERLAADAQEDRSASDQQLIHCNSRLMELAEAAGDEYAEHLHRGIGLFLLARRRAGLPEPEGELPVEGLLCKAAAELTLARLSHPQEARPGWYLYQVWTQLGQRQPALCRLREAHAAAPLSYLTAAEQRALCLAYEAYLTELRVR
jgi:hypothetical protein